MATNASQQAKAQEAGKAAAPTRAPAPVLAPAVPELPALQDAIGNHAVGSLLEGGALIQRKCKECTESGSTCAGCQDEAVRRSAAPGTPAPASLPGAVTTALGSGGGSGLDLTTRAFMESRFGRSFGGVRVHADDTAARAADAIGAQAFTVGSSIWFGRGAYDTSRPEGLHLLAHELTHTVQQRGRASAPQASLRVGSVSDPAEFAADHAADAVLGGRPVARIGASGAAIRRKPKVSPVQGKPAQRLVEMDDGKKYRVTQHIDWRQVPKSVPDSPLKFDAKITKDRVWLQVDYCKETNEVSVQVGANVPAAAASVLKDVILKGTDPKDALKNAEIEPFLSVAVAKSKKYEVTVEPTIKVVPGQGEVTGGGIKGRIKLPGGFEGTLEGSVNKPPEGSGRTGPDVRVQGGVEYKFGGGPKKVECKTVTRQEWEPTIDYTCEELVPEHEEDRTRPVTKRKSVYLYYKYAKAEFENRAKEPGGKLNPANMADLKAALGDRWKVTAITGHASPEGPMDPNARFQGNKALSDDRATTAKKWVEEACPPPSLLDMRPGCFADEFSAEGKGELYSGNTDPELKGKPLAKQAVGEFETNKAETPHRTPDVEKELEKRKASPERQADVVYPLLRRAEVHLARQEEEKYKVTVPDTWKPLDSCPTDVRREAADDFAKGPAPQPPAAKK